MDHQVDVLLVEDNLDDAELTRYALQQNNLGNNLLHLADGVEALDFLFKQGEYEGNSIKALPKIILLDIKMPRLTGIEVLEKIRQDERTNKIPVVMLTSSQEDPDIVACYKLGANSYVVKPVEYDSFVKAVADLGRYWLNVNQGPEC